MPSPPPLSDKTVPRLNTVVSWPIAIGARINIARRAAVARRIAFFIQASFSWYVSSATNVSKHATQRSQALIYAGLFTEVRGR
jgi:hypothetical protein